ncbi:MAG: acyltransferase family protein [Nocardioides sp.]|uniref:acyltransferase family protein n=1 Tax=Nocardioides sp. TaxID=35761 RepID=UPI003F082D8D
MWNVCPGARGHTTVRRRIDSVDLLRGIAVALVMLRHAAPSVFEGAGVVGVVMFFALSGYLIAGVLLDELAATGSLRLRAFYARRARRLVPALVVMLCGVTVVTLLHDPLGERDLLPTTWLVALTWTANLPGRPETSEASFHLWTLAGEEQFYLLLPALLLFAVRRGRLGTALLLAAGAAVAACAATCWWLRAVPDNAYVLPTSWAACFVIGVVARWGRDRVPHPPTAAVGAALAILLVLSVLDVRGHVWTYTVVGPLVATATVTLLLGWRNWVRVTPPALRCLVLLGTVSYGAYLWNYPLTLWLRPYGASGSLVAAVLTVVVAALSWRFVERPLVASAHARARAREKVPSW